MWKSSYLLSFLLFAALILIGCNDEQTVAPEPTLSPTETIEVAAELPTPTATQTLTPTPLPSATTPPTSTATPTETPSPTPTVFTFVREGTAVPPASAPITTENAVNLTQFARWGRGVIHDVAFSGNGRWLAVSTATGIYLHNAENLAEDPRWIPTEAPVDQITFSPDSNLIAAFLPRQGVSIWQVDDGELIQAFPTVVGDIVFSTGNQFVALIAPFYQQKAQIWSVASGELVREYPSSYGLAFLPDASSYAILDQEDDLVFIKTYQLSDHSLLTSAQVDFTGFDDGFTSMSISPDGQMVLLGKGSLIGRNDAGSIEVRKIETGVLVYKIEPILAKSPGPYFCDSNFVSFEPLYDSVPSEIAVSPNGNQLTVTYEEQNVTGKTVAVYRVADGQLLHRFMDGVNSATYSPDGRFIVTGSEDGNLYVWEADSFALTEAIPAYDPPITGVTLSPDGNIMAIESKYSVQLRQANNGTLLQAYESAIKATFSPSGEQLALGFADGHIDVYTLPDRSLTYQINERSSPVHLLAFSPNDQFLAAVAQDCSKSIYRASDGAYLHALEDLIEDIDPVGETRLQIGSLVFSPDSSKIVADFISSPQLGIWETENGRLFSVFPETDIGGVDNLVPVPNSNQFAGLGGTYSATDFSFWDLASLDLDSEFSGAELSNTYYTDLTFTPDGAILAAATNQGTVNLWQVARQQVLQSLSIDTFVYRVDFFFSPSVIFSPDGTSLISGTSDGLIYLWRVP